MKTSLIRILALLIAVLALVSRGDFVATGPSLLVSTFSIVAIDLENGDVGVAVQSKFPNVRPLVPWAEAGVGAVATQSFVNATYGPRGLTLMRNGATAAEALAILTSTDSDKHNRQAGIVDSKGNAASWTGQECFEWAGGYAGTTAAKRGVIATGKGYAVQGNILAGQATVDAMARTFEQTKGALADRLLAALVAGGRAGGDRRGEQSAALLVKRKGAGYDGSSDDLVDISIYDHKTPLRELERLYALHKLHFLRSDPANLMPVDKALATELQTLMSNTAYRGFQFYAGPINGIYDAATKKALRDFMGWENYDVRIRDDDQIDREVLADIRKNYAEWKARK
jgi:uncharacterized Ntn-hydrolase superfamily protein